MLNSRILLPLFATLLASCAQIVTPTGGGKDHSAPEIVSVNPENKAINFNQREVVLKFNEYIQLNNPDEQIIISPPLSERPDFTIKGKILMIKLKAPLKSNTTYTINFGNAIGDNTENNQVANLTYTFTTGTKLDSNSISGTVINSFTGIPEKSTLIALYDTAGFNDSTCFKSQPMYLAKTDDIGHFFVQNLPAYSFYLFAFKDDNKNLKIDKTEHLAYQSFSTSSVDTIAKNLNLRLFKPDAFLPTQIIDTFSREPNRFQFVIYKASSDIEISRTDKKTTLVKKIEGKEYADTFIVYTEISKGEKCVFTVNQNDISQQISLTNKVLFKAPKLNVTYNRQPELNDSVRLVFNIPIITTDTTRIHLYQDSVKVPFSVIKKTPFEFALVHQWAERKTYKLIIGDSAFTDFYNQPNKKDQTSFTSKTTKDYANLLLHVKISNSKVKHPIVLQIIGNDELKPDYQFSLDKSTDINIPFMLPGSYRIKYIYDTNGNGKWDNGDYSLGKQPELVRFIPEILQMKAYWDLEQSVLID